jgi:hypothetical protein
MSLLNRSKLLNRGQDPNQCLNQDFDGLQIVDIVSYSPLNSANGSLLEPRPGFHPEKTEHRHSCDIPYNQIPFRDCFTGHQYQEHILGCPALVRSRLLSTSCGTRSSQLFIVLDCAVNSRNFLTWIVGI